MTMLANDAAVGLHIPGFVIASIWHERTTNHPAQSWLREARCVGTRGSHPSVLFARVREVGQTERASVLLVGRMAAFVVQKRTSGNHIASFRAVTQVWLRACLP
jgi:hypothetical protein